MMDAESYDVFFYLDKSRYNWIEKLNGIEQFVDK